MGRRRMSAAHRFRRNPAPGAGWSSPECTRGNGDKRLVSILSLGDFATGSEVQHAAGDALAGASRPGGQHS
jgi:hypothetical protein